MLAERLVADRGYEVEVLTTCALDAITWRDELPEGTSVERGVTVRRFRSQAGRNEHFHPLWAQLMEDPGAASAEDCAKWVAWQGPLATDLSRRWRRATPTWWPSTRTSTTRRCTGCRWCGSGRCCIQLRTRSRRCTCPSSTSCSACVVGLRSTAGASGHWSTLASGWHRRRRCSSGSEWRSPRRWRGLGAARGRRRRRCGPPSGSGPGTSPTWSASGGWTTRRGRACSGAGSAPTRSATRGR